MKLAKLLLLLPLVAALAGCHPTTLAPPPAMATAPSNALRSPWDATPVAVTAAAYTCGPAVPVSPDILITDDLGSDKRGLSDEVKQAVYANSSTALEDLTRHVVDAADTFQATGSHDAAVCVANLLGDAAAHGAMTGTIATERAWEEQNYALRALAIAYLKVRTANLTDPRAAAGTLAWMEALAHMERSYYEHRPCGPKRCDLHAHRGEAAAMAAAAVAIAANDRGLLHWSEGEYRAAVGQINDQGHIHIDMNGRYAFLNNLKSVASLVQIAELAETNGDALYGYDNGRIHRLVHTVALGFIDPTPYKISARAVQITHQPLETWEITWASVYNRRFPDPILTGLLRQVGPVGADRWGGEPWNPTGEQ